MVTRDFSGEDVYKVLVNTGNFRHVRTQGDHLMLRWEPPVDHDTEPRQVTVPLHDRLRIGTLREIAKDAGAHDFEAFWRWIDRNRYWCRDEPMVVRAPIRVTGGSGQGRD